ncbi:MAG: hypothetical protein IPM79_02575 [Polyangiaceae bacterium]|nr:hypothetical protein [Polyangiaceae bacterium]
MPEPSGEGDRFVDAPELEPQGLSGPRDAVHQHHVGLERLHLREDEEGSDVPEDGEHHAADVDLADTLELDGGPRDAGLRLGIVDLTRLRRGGERILEAGHQRSDHAARRVLLVLEEAPEPRDEHPGPTAAVGAAAAREVALYEVDVRDVLLPLGFGLGLDDHVALVGQDVVHAGCARPEHEREPHPHP